MFRTDGEESMFLSREISAEDLRILPSSVHVHQILPPQFVLSNYRGSALGVSGQLQITASLALPCEEYIYIQAQIHRREFNTWPKTFGEKGAKLGRNGSNKHLARSPANGSTRQHIGAYAYTEWQIMAYI